MTTREDRRQHWQRVWTTRSPRDVSWYEPEAQRSLALVREAAGSPTASVVDVGGGASVLVDGLLGAGFVDVAVLDVSGAALAAARARLGPAADQVRWIEADALDAPLADHSIDVWHDRAVFHFLTDPADRARYARQLLRVLRPGGAIVIACFAPDGPEKCSGLPVIRYDATALAAELGPAFSLVRADRAEHATPAGAVQRFLYAVFRRRTDRDREDPPK